MKALKEQYETIQNRIEGKGNVRPGELGLKTGDNIVRIMPPHDNMDHFSLEIGVHYSIGEDNTRIYCPKFMAGKKCPVCREVKRLYATKDDDDKELAGDLRVKKRFLLNVVNMEDPSKGVLKLEIGTKLHQKVLKLILNPDYGDITDPKTGRTLTIDKTTVKGNDGNLYPDYGLTPKGKPTKLPDKYWKKWQKGIYDLPKEIKLLSFKEIAAMLEEDDEDLSEQATGVVEEETTEDDFGDLTKDEDPLMEDDSLEEEVEEEKPKPKLKKEEPEEDDFGDLEEELEETNTDDDDDSVPFDTDDDDDPFDTDDDEPEPEKEEEATSDDFEDLESELLNELEEEGAFDED